jgi:hypothetical protein
MEIYMVSRYIARFIYEIVMLNLRILNNVVPALKVRDR